MEKCYKCGGKLNGIYQVMIYNPELKFVKCCCEECAESLKSENASHLYELYSVINRQVIQIIKREDIAPEELIKRFTKKYGYDYTVDDILHCYQNEVMKGYQHKLSSTMKICIENLENEIRTVLELD